MERKRLRALYQMVRRCWERTRKAGHALLLGVDSDVGAGVSVVVQRGPSEIRLEIKLRPILSHWPPAPAPNACSRADQPSSRLKKGSFLYRWWVGSLFLSSTSLSLRRGS